jgi:hypothetical protein
MDYILNGVGQGSVAQQLLACNMDAGSLRPFRWTNNKGQTGSYVTLNDGKTYQVNNANATLTKEDWITLDKTVVKVARDRLNVVRDINAAGLTYNLPNGMGHTVLQTQSQSDTNDADISMDGITKTDADRPEYDLVNLPLPVVHKDFFFTAREIQVSRNGVPLDMTMVEQSARKVSETVEKLTLGQMPTQKYGGGEIFGLTNFGDRLTKTLTAPTASGWTPQTTYVEIIAMLQQAQDVHQYGPFRVYFAPNWMQYMALDYTENYLGGTLQEKISKLGQVSQISQADYLTNFDIVVVRFASDVIRMVNGLPLQTVQWPSHGGFKLNFKVITLQVPQVRSDFNSSCGIVHGSTV